MNTMTISMEELYALDGLPYVQQLAYIRGIRPYMDVKTALVGIKRGISYQSIAEQLYIEPHQGIKSGNVSRAQVRRAVAGLERAGLISLQSKGLQLIIKCDLAILGYFVQNKAVTFPSQKVDPIPSHDSTDNHELNRGKTIKTDPISNTKADTPLKDNNLFLFFEKFWESYPQKHDKNLAWLAFQRINPSPELFEKILTALLNQINHRNDLQTQGIWIPAWKYPANWLEQQCWENELQFELPQEKQHAASRNTHAKLKTTDYFWESCKPGIKDAHNPPECEGNTLPIDQYRGTAQKH